MGLQVLYTDSLMNPYYCATATHGITSLGCLPACLPTYRLTTTRFGNVDATTGPVLGAFYDGSQLPHAGILVVTKASIIMFNPNSGDRRLRVWADNRVSNNDNDNNIHIRTDRRPATGRRRHSRGGATSSAKTKARNTCVYTSCCYREAQNGQSGFIVVGTSTGLVVIRRAHDLDVVQICKRKEDDFRAAGSVHNSTISGRGNPYRRESSDEEGEMAIDLQAFAVSSPITSVIFPSPDTICSGNLNGVVRIYNVATGREELSIPSLDRHGSAERDNGKDAAEPSVSVTALGMTPRHFSRTVFSILY